jgi:hypothetical protein
MAANKDMINASVQPTVTVDEMVKLEKVENRAYEKANERMQLELCAMEAKFVSREEERIRKAVEERERRDAELRREIAYERWRDEADKEIRRQEEEMEEEKVAKQLYVDVQTKSSGDQGGKDVDDHPILGPQIATLPYKRVHLTPASTLASIPVYERQRAYRHNRAWMMAKDKRKTLWMGIPGIISLMEDDDGRLCILDGQHRVGMMALLAEE